jgi:hypothetical protein
VVQPWVMVMVEVDDSQASGRELYDLREQPRAQNNEARRCLPASKARLCTTIETDRIGPDQRRARHCIILTVELDQSTSCIRRVKTREPRRCC